MDHKFVFVETIYGRRFEKEHLNMNLYKAVCRRDLDACQRYLQEKADPNFQNKSYNCWTPLYVAIYSGFHECIKLLLNNGADINMINDKGYAPMHCAMLSRNISTIEILLAHGADPNIQDNDGDTPLHFLFTTIPDRDIILLLIKHEADCSIKNKKGVTVEELALKSYNSSINEIFSVNFDIKEPCE